MNGQKSSPGRDITLRKAFFLIGLIITLIGIAFLSVPKPSANLDGEFSISKVMRIEAYKNDSFNVTLGGNLTVTVILDTKFAPGVSADAYSKGEGCIDLYVVDQENYRKWIDKENYATYLTASGVHSSSFMFQSSSVAKTYYFILDNSWRCTEKVVNIQITTSSKPIFGGPQFQVAGLGSLSLGVLVTIYGLVKEKAPITNVERKEEDLTETGITEQ